MKEKTKLKKDKRCIATVASAVALSFSIRGKLGVKTPLSFSKSLFFDRMKPASWNPNETIHEKT